MRAAAGCGYGFAAARSDIHPLQGGRQMNGKVEACKEALMDAIRESEEYLQYEESKAEVAGHPELHHLIDDYRRDVYLLQNSSQGNDVSEEMQRMFARRHELCKNEIIHRYITRELSMCRMLQKAVGKKDPSTYEPWMKALMCAVGQKCDWTDRKYLESLINYIKQE